MKKNCNILIWIVIFLLLLILFMVYYNNQINESFQNSLNYASVGQGCGCRRRCRRCQGCGCGGKCLGCQRCRCGM